MRRRQLRQTEDLIRLLQRRIRCENRPLAAILRDADIPLPLLRSFCADEPFDLLSAYAAAKEKSASEMFFSPSDWEWCDRLFSGLGAGDTDGQIEHLRRCEAAVNDACRDADHALRRNGKTAVLCGVCVGVMLVLILIE